MRVTINQIKEMKPKGEKIGWVGHSEVLFQPDAVFGTIQKMARDQGSSFPIGDTTLWKRLAEKKLTIVEEKKNLVKRTVGGKRRYVLAFNLETFEALIGNQGTLGTKETGPEPKKPLMSLVPQEPYQASLDYPGEFSPIMPKSEESPPATDPISKDYDDKNCGMV